MNNNTGIRIEAIKEVNSKGEYGYRITKIKALTAKELPDAYLDFPAREICFMVQTCCKRFLQCISIEHEKDRLIVGQWIGKHEFLAWQKYISRAGQHLTDVNRELAEKREDWNGLSVFIDGEQQK